MIDVTEQISAVRREVGGRVLAAGEARVITVSRSYPAELADVWDACTNPERIPRWFLPVAGDLPLLYLSAAPDREVASRFPNLLVLQKPFRTADLLSAVNELTSTS